MTLSAADLERARELAAAAPPPGADLIARLRAILAGVEPVQLPPVATPTQDRGGRADAA